MLIRGSDEEEVRADAVVLGREDEHEYKTPIGVLRWEFVQIERVCEIQDNLRHGAELFSRFLRHAEVQSLLTPFDEE